MKRRTTPIPADLQAIMKDWKRGVLTKDIPNCIGAEYKAGDELLLNPVNNLHWHVKEGIHVALQRSEYKAL